VIKSIDPGAFRSKLVLQALVTTGKDTFGQPTLVWDDVATIWAKVSPLSAREAFWASQIQASTTHTIVCRYDPRIVTTARLRMGSRIFNLDGPPRDLDERNIYMVINAIERAPSEQ
jgi:SPP1 family predicted phage head-tail adaptor